MSCVAESSMLFSHRSLSELNFTDNIFLNVILSKKKKKKVTQKHNI